MSSASERDRRGSGFPGEGDNSRPPHRTTAIAAVDLLIVRDARVGGGVEVSATLTTGGAISPIEFGFPAGTWLAVYQHPTRSWYPMTATREAGPREEVTSGGLDGTTPGRGRASLVEEIEYMWWKAALDEGQASM